MTQIFAEPEAREFFTTDEHGFSRTFNRREPYQGTKMFYKEPRKQETESRGMFYHGLLIPGPSATFCSLPVLTFLIAGGDL